MFALDGSDRVWGSSAVVVPGTMGAYTVDGPSTECAPVPWDPSAPGSNDYGQGDGGYDNDGGYDDYDDGDDDGGAVEQEEEEQGLEINRDGLLKATRTVEKIEIGYVFVSCILSWVD